MTLFSIILLWASESGDARDLQSRVIKAAQDANIHEVIEGLPEKYQTFVGDRGVRLSGGEKQRLAIARELFRNPEILILDEATSALDSVSERIIQTNLGKLLGSFTMITVAHRLATVKSADNVLVLDQGRVVEAGTFDELSGERCNIICRYVKRPKTLIEGLYYSVSNVNKTWTLKNR